MAIDERKGRDGQDRVRSVSSRERRLEDIVARLNRFERATTRSRSRRSPRSRSSTSAPTSSSRSRSMQATSNELTAKLRAPVPSAALPTLGVVRPQSVARRGSGRRRSASRRSARPVGKRQRCAEAREGRRPTAISASLEYYRAHARRRERGRVLPDRTATCSRCTSPTSAQWTAETAASDRRAARAAVRQGGARVDRGGRLSRGARARRVPARAQGRAAAAVARCR